MVSYIAGFPDGSDGKESARNVGDPGSIPGSGRSPGEGNGNPLQYSCLKNSMACCLRSLVATDHGVAKSGAQLRDFTFAHLKAAQCHSLSRCPPWRLATVVRFLHGCDLLEERGCFTSIPGT